MRIVVTGATGFLGTKLCHRLVRDRHEVTAFTRDASRSRDDLHPKVTVISWAEGAPRWEQLVDGADALVNLAGEPIAQRWTARSKERILRSRVAATERLHGPVERAATRPKVLVNASAIGYYGPHDDEELTEESRPGTDFLAAVCVKWEEAARRFEPLGLRVVRLRTGVVLSPDGGALPQLLLPFKMHSGGPVGTGRQWVSWIHVDDLVEILVLALENAAASGAINGTAPNPVRNADLAAELGRVMNRRLWFPGSAAAAVAKAKLGDGATIVLDGQRVLPKRAEALGYKFGYSHLRAALEHLLG